MPLDPTELFPFPLDPFQLESMEAIEASKNLILCAPTGSGKTAVAEYAIERAIRAGRRCFYTTPLKALSNQKFQDFCARWGESEVGLLTGDVSVRRHAPVVVMTTEVYRNMLYGTNLGDVGENVKGVQSVILDECHYMNDAERGTVWEESIIYTPRSVQLVGLSATVANSRELADWIGSIHRQTHLVTTDFRPVPLRHYYCHRDSLYRFFVNGRVNPKLFRLIDQRPKGRRGRSKDRQPGLTSEGVVKQLAHHDMLPAIYFVFSRRGCEKALRDAQGALRMPGHLRVQLRQRIEEAVEAHPGFARHPHLPALYRGLAVHHAGVLPAWKSLVENLFGQGLIQVVFATETLAAGINMPARTTVISAISKYSGEGHRVLTGSEFLQMSGRAGRRGMDEVGNVVVLHHPKEDVRQAVVLARAPAEPLESNFRPSYGMVLNLLQRRTLEEARQLVEMSFGQFLARREAVRHDREASQLEERHQDLSRPLCPGELGDQRLYRKTRERYRAAIKQARSLTGTEPEVVQERERLARRRQGLKEAFESSPCHGCPVFDPCREQERERNRVERDLRLLKRIEEKVGTPYWSEFERLADVLRETQYLREDQPTEAGEMAACLRATNVLFLAEVIGSGVLEELRPAEAAAAITALVTEEGRRQQHVERPPVSRYVHEVLHRLELISDRVLDLQERYRVEVPLELNGMFCGVTESWARGTDWETLERQVSLEAGDIIRLLRRTLDVCRQFAYSRGVPQRLSELCRQAERKIARDEVRESLTMVGLVNPGEDLTIEESL